MPRRRTIFPRRNVAPRTFIGNDDTRLTVIRRDFTGGTNSRQHPSVINKNECLNVTNSDLTIPGEAPRRPGITLIQDVSNDPGTGAFGFEPDGYTNNLLITEGTNLRRWSGSGTFSVVKNDFTTNLSTKMIKAYKTGVGDVLLVSNGTDNVFEVEPSAYADTDLGDTNTSPPLTTVMESFRNRVWALKDGILYYSSASPSDYSTAFDRTTNNYKLSVGTERALKGTRELGILIVGDSEIWALDPSVTPAATDKPEKMSEYGCASGPTFQQLGDDYFYLAYDGVRGLKRTALDKLQYGSSLPISYKLKDQFDAISWANITKSCAVVWDNKYFIALPSGSATNNQVWVYYPATSGWAVIDGWNVAAWATLKVSGEERLYYIDATDGKIYRAWFGSDDNGTAIKYSIEGRNEDMGYPTQKKYGGELKVVMKPAGNYNVEVYAAFDSGGYNLLGYHNVSGNLITFPVTFPVAFYPESITYEKFPLDAYGEWYQIRFKVYHDATTTNANDITLYEMSLTSLLQEYDPEEEI